MDAKSYFFENIEHMDKVVVGPIHIREIVCANCMKCDSRCVCLGPAQALIRDIVIPARVTRER